MHRLMAGVTILEHELSELRLLVERQAGILLDCPNSILAAHVANYLERRELDSPAALVAHLSGSDQDPACLPEFLDGVLNVNTGFFRHPGAMNALARQVIPRDVCPQVGRRTFHSTHLECRLRLGRRSLFDRDGTMQSPAQWQRFGQRLEQRQREWKRHEGKKCCQPQRRHC